jgi:hypothetical protein
MRDFQFPPYGEFDRGYIEGINPHVLFPLAWRPHLTLDQRKESWLHWRRETLRLINELLWPRWDTETCAWIDPNLDLMIRLTERDFTLFGEIAGDAILHKQPKTAVSSKATPSHFDFFQDEDSGALGVRYNYYDVTLPMAQLAAVTNYKVVLDAKAGSGSVSLQFKQQLQRPRAYQVAQLMGKRHFYERAATSTTPSMSSGHCFQACILMAGIYESWLSDGFTPTSDQLAALAQFAVDIGDRRVFAGVHFPSDNMASWIIALRLVGEVCLERQVGAFLANAIQRHSYVYRLLKSSGFDEYKPALSEIDLLLRSHTSETV